MLALVFLDKYFLYHRQIGSKPYTCIHVLICKPNIGYVDIHVLYVYMHKTGTLH